MAGRLFGLVSLSLRHTPILLVPKTSICSIASQQISKRVNAAFDIGINIFDHADIYEGGQSVLNCSPNKTYSHYPNSHPSCVILTNSLE